MLLVADDKVVESVVCVGVYVPFYAAPHVPIFTQIWNSQLQLIQKRFSTFLIEKSIRNDFVACNSNSSFTMRNN